MTFDWTQGALAEGLRCYEAGEFFAAHEAWESVWLQSQEPDKTFLQGIIQVAAAFHHLQRNNPLGATRLWQAALRRLESYPPTFGNLSVTLLSNDIHDRLQALQSDPSIRELAKARIQPLPRKPLHGA